MKITSRIGKLVLVAVFAVFAVSAVGFGVGTAEAAVKSPHCVAVQDALQADFNMLVDLASAAYDRHDTKLGDAYTAAAVDTARRYASACH